MKRTTLTVTLFAALLLAGCGSGAKNEAAEAGSTVTADPNATMAEAVKDVDAASDKAFGAGEAGAGNAADEIGDTGNEIQD